jgi:hypothetical protein
MVTSDLLNELNDYEYLKDFKLIINGNSNRSTDKILELYDIALEKIDKRDKKIERLTFTIDSLKLAVSSQHNSIYGFDFIDLAKDAKIQFSELESFSFAQTLRSPNFRTVDTVLVATARWNSFVNDSLLSQKNADLKIWLEQELEDDIEILTY